MGQVMHHHGLANPERSSIHDAGGRPGSGDGRTVRQELHRSGAHHFTAPHVQLYGPSHPGPWSSSSAQVEQSFAWMVQGARPYVVIVPAPIIAPLLP